MLLDYTHHGDIARLQENGERRPQVAFGIVFFILSDTAPCRGLSVFVTRRVLVFGILDRIAFVCAWLSVAEY